MTDTQGHLLYVHVHAANTHDTVAGCCVFEKALQKYPCLQGVCADAGYRKTMEEFVEKVLKKTIAISKRIKPLHTHKKLITLMAVNLPLTEAALATKSLWGIGLPLNIS